jgi:hypothetical protein
MITPARAIIGVLAIAVVGLGTALGIALASDEDGSDDQAMDGQGMTGMMSAMASMDSDAMLAHMKEVLGEDGFRRMQEHFQNHDSSMPMTGMTDVDTMMHAMMDGMMAEMPADSNNILPPSDAHHETPAASSSSTPAR